jgi:3-methyladenine DNA glycosylase AlkD
MYLSGPMWARGSISIKMVLGWASSQDFWWRRVALVSTVLLSRSGNANDILNVVTICTLLVADREDMVVKALSWALRELSKTHPEDASTFLAKHRNILAARVVREVTNKLTTGLKTPRGSHANDRGMTAT